MFDYSYLCECGWEGGPYRTLRECRGAAKAHLTDRKCGIPAPTIFIDQYSFADDELSGRYWKMKKATPARS